MEGRRGGGAMCSESQEGNQLVSFVCVCMYSRRQYKVSVSYRNIPFTDHTVLKRNNALLTIPFSVFSLGFFEGVVGGWGRH